MVESKVGVRMESTVSENTQNTEPLRERCVSSSQPVCSHESGYTCVSGCGVLWSSLRRSLQQKELHLRLLQSLENTYLNARSLMLEPSNAPASQTWRISPLTFPQRTHFNPYVVFLSSLLKISKSFVFHCFDWYHGCSWGWPESIFVHTVLLAIHPGTAVCLIS